ncbi:MAG: hypothetical protein ACAH07_06035 [Methylophilaceae bacterium]|nr:hypothetical protein [Methyloradius sp.]
MANSNNPEIVISAVDKTKAAVDSATTNLKKLESAGNSLNSSIGRLAPLLGAATFIGLVKGSIDAADNLNDLSKETGIAVDQLSSYKLAAEQSGTSTETLAKGMQKLSVNISGNQKTLLALGINAKVPNEAFIQLAGVLERVTDVNDRNKLGTQLLGKSYLELKPLLAEGEAGIRKMLEAGQEYNSVTKEMAEQSDQLNDSIATLELQGSSLGNSIAKELLPGLNELVASLIENNKESGLLLGSLKGIYDLGGIVIFGSEQENRAKRMKDIVAEIQVIDEKLRSGKTNSAYTDKIAAGANPNFLAPPTGIDEDGITNLKSKAYALSLELQRLSQQQNANVKVPGASLTDDQKKALKGILSPEDVAKQTAAAEKVKNSYDTITKKSGEYVVAIQYETQEGEKLSEGQKNVADLRAFLTDKTNVLTSAQKANLQSLIDQVAAGDANNKALEDRKDRISALVEYQMKYNEAAKAHTEGLQEATRVYDDSVNSTNDQIKSVQDQINVLKYGEVATLQMENARLLEAAAAFEQSAAYAAQNGVSDENVKSMLDRADALRKLASGRAELASKQRELTDLNKWKDLASNAFDNVYSALSDALFRGFERGESFGKNFLSRLKDLFKTTTLQLGAQIILDPIKKSVLEGFGSISTGSGGSTGSSLTSSLGSIQKLTDLISGKGGSLSDSLVSGIASQVAGLGNFLGSTGLSTFANGLAVSSGSVSAAGASVAASQLGTSSALSVGKFVGSYGPYIGAAIQALSGDLKGAAFTAAGAAIGSVVPGIGTAIGAAIGSILGSFVGGGLSYNNVNENASYSNGKFYQGALANNSRGNIAYSALPALNGLGKQFGDSVGQLLTAFGESDKQNQLFSVKFGKQLEASLTYTLDNGKSGYVGKWGSNYGDTSEAAVAAFIEDVLSKGIIGALKISNLSSDIKGLFDTVSTSAQVASLISATVKLKNAQDELANRFGLTVDQAAKLSKATGLAGDDLINFVSALGDTALGVKSQFKDLIAARTTLMGIVGQDLPDSVDAFDGLIKGIDKSTADGINKALSFLSNRAAFVAYTTSIDALKSGVSGAVFGLKTPQQQADGMQADLKVMFDALGLAVPQSKEQLIALGESIDYTTEAGLTLANAFPTLVTAFNSTQSAIASLATSLDALDINNFKTLVDYTRAKSYVANGISLTKLPAFASGGDFGGGLRLVGERGMELEATGPSRIVSNNDLISRLRSPVANQTALLEAVKSLSAEVAELRSNTQSENVAMLQKTELMLKSLRQMNDDGIMLRDIDTAGNATVLDVRVVS